MYQIGDKIIVPGEIFCLLKRRYPELKTNVLTISGVIETGNGEMYQFDGCCVCTKKMLDNCVKFER